MDIIFVPLLILIKAICGLITGVVLIDVLLHWLLIADVFNINNKFVNAAIDIFARISNFFLNPIRRTAPIRAMSFDISPLILILFLLFVEHVINRILLRFV